MTNKAVLNYISSLLFIFLFSPAFLNAQDYTVKGTVKGFVKDAAGNGIASVTVKVKGKVSAVVTATDGSFSLPLPGPKCVIDFSSVGFRNKSVEINGEENIIVVLEESSIPQSIASQYNGKNDGVVAFRRESILRDAEIHGVDRETYKNRHAH